MQVVDVIVQKLRIKAKNRGEIDWKKNVFKETEKDIYKKACSEKQTKNDIKIHKNICIEKQTWQHEVDHTDGLCCFVAKVVVNLNSQINMNNNIYQ